MAASKGYLFAPEEVGALLTHAGGRWKLWKEQEATVEVNFNDPSEVYTAACWLAPAGSGRHVLVLGCANGSIQAWDSSTGELLGRSTGFRSLVQGAECGVSALAASSHSRGTVFASSFGTPEVLEVGVLDGEVRGSFRSGKAGLCCLAAALAHGGQEWLLAAAPNTALKIWQLPGHGATLRNLKKAHKRLAQPANAATSVDLCCLGGRLLAACADGTMQVDFFDLGAESGTKGAGELQALPSTRILSCRERVRSVLFARHVSTGGSSGRLVVIGYAQHIVACWAFDMGVADASGKTVAPAFVVAQAELGGSILCARADSANAAAAGDSGMDSDKLAIVVAYGSSAKPLFAHVRAPRAKEGVRIVPLGRESIRAKAAEEPGSARDILGGAPKISPTVLGPAEIAASRQQKRAAEEDGPAQKRQKQPMPGSRPATAGSNLSLAPILRQGLRAKDSSSLDKTLVLKDRDLMETSVAELSGSEAFDLLQECAKRLLERPMEGQVFCAWIQRVLLHHCGFIASQPALQEALRPLHDSTAARCASHRSLVRLRGRLQSLVSHGKQVLERKEQEQATVRAPLLEYVEGDEDAQGEEDESDEEEPDDEEEDDDDDDEDIDLDADDWLDSDDLG
eukprot:TRINITY_DN18993_c0_g1_i1.p1 TRINITY_DN18993_c0_g1~~TRINITY_DN18993_c0_g1_i1.p1  ORF type:complete len:625 (-),score=151.44 TRINITY_DN18993_c0_g1_i1:83-1957(-)